MPLVVQTPASGEAGAWIASAAYPLSASMWISWVRIRSYAGVVKTRTQENSRPVRSEQAGVVRFGKHLSDRQPCRWCLMELSEYGMQEEPSCASLSDCDAIQGGTIANPTIPKDAGTVRH